MCATSPGFVSEIVDDSRPNSRRRITHGSPVVLGRHPMTSCNGPARTSRLGHHMMRPMSKLTLLIVNENSRRGGDKGKAVVTALGRAGVEVWQCHYKTAAELPGLIHGFAGQVNRVVVGGGDGTLNATLPGLLDTGLPLGVIPLGTANDLARTLRIPLDLNAAARVIAGGRTKRVDVGEVNGYPFFNVASIGFGVDLTRALTRDSKRRFGSLGYAIAALRAVRRLRPFHVEIQHGEAVHTSRTIHVAVGNGRHYGGGMTVSECASLDDGRFHVYSLEISSFWRLLFLLPALRSGRHRPWAEIHTLAGEKIEIRTSRLRSVNADGEIITKTPAIFRVLPAALEVYVP